MRQYVATRCYSFGSVISNLGFIFDSDMSYTNQINSLSESCHIHIRDIRRIRHLILLSLSLSLQLQRLLIHSSPANLIDCCNSLYHGTSKDNEQNAAHTKYSGSCRYKYIKIWTHHTNTQKLHWLPMRQRIDYKLWLLTYETLQI